MLTPFTVLSRIIIKKSAGGGEPDAIFSATRDMTEEP